MQQGGALFQAVEEEEVSCSRDREVISLRRWRQRRRSRIEVTYVGSATPFSNTSTCFF